MENDTGEVTDGAEDGRYDFEGVVITLLFQPHKAKAKQHQVLHECQDQEQYLNYTPQN